MINLKRLLSLLSADRSLGEVLAVIIVSIISMLLWSHINHPLKACDLNRAANRNFDHYYGLNKIENPLSLFNAEDRAATSSKICDLFHDHIHLLPYGNRASSKSMIVQGLRGSGKTQIRQCIISQLSGKNRILINIYGADINAYLENFVNNIDVVAVDRHEKIRKYWIKEHFLQVILTEIASRFVNKKFIPTLKATRHTISLQTRKEVAALLAFYSTKHSDDLCTMVNLLLYELTECFSCRSIPCNEVQRNNAETEMMIALSERHQKVKVKSRTQDTDACLRLLTAMYKRTESSPLRLLDGSYRDQVASLINFLSTLQITAAVIVDSLDENKFFFEGEVVHLQTLQAFINSTTNDDVLHLALGNWGEDAQIANNFTFYIFIPIISTKPLTIPWTRRDKIPIIELKWNEVQLINYADYMFDYLWSESRGQCKLLPDICSLLGGRDLCLQTMKKLRHPRDFHIFFGILTQHMSDNCIQRNPPFRATQADLENVLKETTQRRLN